MNFSKEDERDLLKLADIIETKEFWNEKDVDGIIVSELPEDKRDGSQFSLENWFFDCGMPSCVGGHGKVEFPGRFTKAEISEEVFAEAFNISLFHSKQITMPNRYKSKNPKPKTVAKRIREVVSRLC